MLVTLWNIEQITPYANNPRHNDHAVDAVAQSIKEFGWRQPIVVDSDGMIIVGDTRYKAAVKLGMKQVPVHVATDLTPAQMKAYRIADNKTADLADWDHDRLVQELAELEHMAFDLDHLGFTPDELQKLLDKEIAPGLTDPDEIPEPPDTPVTRMGDLWTLGKHRLLCGDSSKAEDVARLVAGEPIHLVHSDPPYNVRVEPRSNNAIAAGLSSFAAEGKAVGKLRAKDRPLVNDHIADDEFVRLLHVWFTHCAHVLLPGRAFYVWGGYSNIANYPSALKACGLYFSQTVIWVKEHPVLTRKDFMGNHEWCFYGWREGAAHQFFGPSNVTDVWSVKKVSPQHMVHLTEKPVELAVRAMQYSSRPAESVLDLFGGSGSTLIAAEQTGRRAFLMEIDPLYCDVIVHRFEEFTGQKADCQAVG